PPPACSGSATCRKSLLRRESRASSAPSGNSQCISGGARARHAASSVGPICLHIEPRCVLARRPRAVARNARPLPDGALVFGPPSRNRNRKELAAFCGFISPWFIGFILFAAAPLMISLVLSMATFDLYGVKNFHWIGLAPYCFAV